MKFVRVDMSVKTVVDQSVPDAYRGIGGRALTSSYINDHVPATCDALGPDNVLILAPGYFSGTPLVNTSRFSVGAKSPLTGGIKESNVGGPSRQRWPVTVSPPLSSMDGPSPGSAGSLASTKASAPRFWMPRPTRA